MGNKKIIETINMYRILYFYLKYEGVCIPRKKTKYFNFFNSNSPCLASLLFIKK